MRQWFAGLLVRLAALSLAAFVVLSLTSAALSRPVRTTQAAQVLLSTPQGRSDLSVMLAAVAAPSAGADQQKMAAQIRAGLEDPHTRAAVQLALAHNRPAVSTRGTSTPQGSPPLTTGRPALSASLLREVSATALERSHPRMAARLRSVARQPARPSTAQPAAGAKAGVRAGVKPGGVRAATSPVTSPVTSASTSPVAAFGDLTAVVRARVTKAKGWLAGVSVLLAAAAVAVARWRARVVRRLGVVALTATAGVLLVFYVLPLAIPRLVDLLPGHGPTAQAGAGVAVVLLQVTGRDLVAAVLPVAVIGAGLLVVSWVWSAGSGTFRFLSR